MNVAAPLLWTLPWTAPLIVTLVRAARTRSLTDVPATAPADAPLVSVIIPARNEARNIERCVRSVLSSSYPSFEVIVVDDHSTDGTSDIANGVARDDSRLRVINAPPLPEGWFGKQWACASGAAVARGALLIFTDADTWHAPDLMPRAVNTMQSRGAELLSVAGHQEMHSFWERVVQPQMFALLLARYGGTEIVSNTTIPENAIANGQFILVRHDSYTATGGHASVRHSVAEDLMMAQSFVRAKRCIVLVEGIDQLSTHMYASFRELVRGWGKNIYAGGRNAAIGGASFRALFPIMLLGMPLYALAPFVALCIALSGGLSPDWLVWSATSVGIALLFWIAVYKAMRVSALNALLYPLGLSVIFYIAAGAVLRGNRVEWKNREYLSS